jgi:GT2 family glycosyltransferase
MPTSSMSTPTISVVVATYKRATLLPRLVEAIAGQDVPGALEMIVVDDASPDETPSVLRELAQRYPNLRVVRQADNAGPATARNVGWRQAAAPLVAFTDDDCVPQPGWAAGIIEGLRDADLVQGSTLPNPAQVANIGPFSRTLEVTSDSGFYQTCNMGYRRELLERVSGFDERFPDPAGEDTDLAWRSLAAGATARFLPAALVYHDIRPSSFRTHVADLRRWRSVVLVAKRHPSLRALCYRRFIWRASHEKVLLGSVGLAVFCTPGLSRLTRWTALTLLLPYVWFRVRVQPLAGSRRRRTAAIPAAFLADAIEVGVLARASAHERTLLL